MGLLIGLLWFVAAVTPLAYPASQRIPGWVARLWLLDLLAAYLLTGYVVLGR